MTFDVEQFYAEKMRELGPVGRLQRGLNLFDLGRGMLADKLRAENPDLDDDKIGILMLKWLHGHEPGVQFILKSIQAHGDTSESSADLTAKSGQAV